MRILLLAIAPVLLFGQQFGPKDGLYLGPTDLNRIVAGTPAPDFTLPTGDGRALTLSQFRGRNVVLVFYRGHW